METIVISLGGSVVLADDVDTTFYTALKELFSDFKDKKIFVIVGGGPPAREYISRARSLHISEENLDAIGIAVTRVNALFLACQLQNKLTEIPSSTQEAIDLDQSLVIMGGTSPGHSTDFVGAELASLANVDLFVIATNVDGVFDKDPKTSDDAKMYTSISAQELLEKYGGSWNAAGSNTVIDGPALQKIHDEHIPTIVVNGKQIKNLKKALNHQEFHGTTITK